MATYWDRSELDNPPANLESKRKEAGYEWVPCPGSKRKLDIYPEDIAYEEEIKPSPKLAAIDETIKEDILDENGFIKGYELSTAANNAMLPSEKVETTVGEPEPMMMDEEEQEVDVIETGLPACMVKSGNKTNGGGKGYQHELQLHHKIGNKVIQGVESLILSHEVQNSMAREPIDISTVLAQKMIKQATMAVVLWKPQVAIPLGGTVMNSPGLTSQNNKHLGNRYVHTKNEAEDQEDKMET